MIDLGTRSKQSFQQDADECMRFFNGPYDFLYGLSEGPQRGDFMYVGMKRLPRPSIVCTVNKVAEGVQLFGPTLYHDNPDCTVTPRKPPDIPLQVFGDMNDPMVQMQVQPMMQQMSQQQLTDSVRAILLQGLLHYLPTAINLRESSRDAIDEGIIKGAAFLLFDMSDPSQGRKMPYPIWKTVDDLIFDPDHETMKDARWMAVRMIEPTWEVEARRGLPPETLKGNYESHSSIASVAGAGNEYQKRNGKTNDLLVYWRVWSKMGLGGLLRGIPKEAAEADRFGRYVYFEICDGYEYMLNCPPEIWDSEEECKRRMQWETPFWRDVPSTMGWPIEVLAFHKVPRQVWPMSHFRPGLGELKFINWGYSFLISAIQKRCRDFIVCAKGLDEETKTKILEGNDLELIEMSQAMGMPIDQLVGFIKHPDFSEGIFKVIEKVELNFEKRVNLPEILYGETAHAFRSAEEASLKQGQANVRIDDMATTVEAWMTGVFRKMALMARWHMTGEDLAQLYGPVIGQLWAKFVETADIDEVINQLEYRIEAGSTRKPNKDKDVQDANSLVQMLFPLLSQFAMQTGNVQPFNALLLFWGEALDKDVSKMLLPAPPPPPMGPPVPGQPGHPPHPTSAPGAHPPTGNGQPPHANGQSPPQGIPQPPPSPMPAMR
jgi:hypothetical protein